MREKQAQSILFADVCGSTALFEQLGDETARSLIGAVLTRLSGFVTEEDGRVVKTIGDEIMCTLPTAEAAIQSAIQMQRAMTSDLDFVKQRVAIRIGLHYGDTLVEEGDVFGDAVNVAARMAGLAKREQIVTTASTVSQAGRPDLETRPLGRIRVKGKLMPIDTCDVLWQEDLGGVTVISQVVKIDEKPDDGERLYIEYGGRTLEMKEFSPPYRFGRDPLSEVVVDHDWVSRNHAKIEHRSGGFVFIDRSTNGSYVQADGARSFRLHRDEARLQGSGVLSLGRAIDATPEEVLVRWSCDHGDSS